MLVTAVDVVDQASDYGLLIPMMEGAEETTRTRAPMTLADAGYFLGSDLEECARRSQLVAVPEARQRLMGTPYHKDQFTYDESSDSFSCPQGQTLPFKRIEQHVRAGQRRLYQASGVICRGCPAFGVCTTSTRYGRSIYTGPREMTLRRHRTWMSTDGVKEVYRLRRQLVEPVFGIIKEQMGLRRFLLRGLVNVAAEWSLLATAFNLRTLWRAWRALYRVNYSCRSCDNYFCRSASSPVSRFCASLVL